MDITDQLEEQKLELLALIGLPKGESSQILDYQFERAIDASKHKNFNGAALNYVRFQYLITELKIIQKHNPLIFNDFISKLTDMKNSDKFYGFRFEVHEATQLIARDIKFDKSEAPDFILANGIGVECTSAHIRGGKIGLQEYARKITKILKEKQKKKYNIDNCILKIDITNLFYELPSEQWQLVIKELPAALTSKINPKRFQAVFLCYYLSNQLNYDAKYHYELIRANSISTTVMNFLNEYYASKGSIVQGPAFPRES